MVEIRSLPWKKFERFLLHIGCEFKRQKGSHRIYWKTGITRPIIVPGKGTISKTVLKSNLNTLGMTLEECVKIIEKM